MNNALDVRVTRDIDDYTMLFYAVSFVDDLYYDRPEINSDKSVT